MRNLADLLPHETFNWEKIFLKNHLKSLNIVLRAYSKWRNTHSRKYTINKSKLELWVCSFWPWSASFSHPQFHVTETLFWLFHPISLPSLYLSGGNTILSIAMRRLEPDHGHLSLSIGRGPTVGQASWKDQQLPPLPSSTCQRCHSREVGHCHCAELLGIPREQVSQEGEVLKQGGDFIQNRKQRIPYLRMLLQMMESLGDTNTSWYWEFHDTASNKLNGRIIRNLTTATTTTKKKEKQQPRKALPGSQ